MYESPPVKYLGPYRTDFGSSVEVMTKRGFTLIELLVVVTIIGLLVAIMLPALSAGRNCAVSASCKVNLNQMGMGLQYYAHDWNDYLMPLEYDGSAGTASSLFWWGKRLDDEDGKVKHSEGVLWP